VKFSFGTRNSQPTKRPKERKKEKEKERERKSGNKNPARSNKAASLLSNQYGIRCEREKSRAADRAISTEAERNKLQLLNRKKQPRDCGKWKHAHNIQCGSMRDRKRGKNHALMYPQYAIQRLMPLAGALSKTRGRDAQQNENELDRSRIRRPICLKVRTCGRNEYIGHRVSVTFPLASREQSWRDGPRARAHVPGGPDLSLDYWRKQNSP